MILLYQFLVFCQDYKIPAPNTPKIDFYLKDDKIYYPDTKNTKLSVLHVANLMF